MGELSLTEISEILCDEGNLLSLAVNDNTIELNNLSQKA
jgi:hypothetical protein